MERRDMIRGLAAFGAIALMPELSARENKITSKLHFIGLGQGGTNAANCLQKKGIKGSYTCITGNYVSHLSPTTNHIYFETPSDFKMNGVNYRKPIGLTQEMKNLLIQDDNYIILTGLGGTAGTGLISSVLEFLKDHQKKFIAICSLPFYNEGRTRNLYALLKQSEIKEMANVHCFDANYLLERNGQLTVREAFARVEDLYYKLFLKYSDHFLGPDVN
ncbi:MAG: hypothetical protein WCP85_02505 [Mariniphaga sp.]